MPLSSDSSDGPSEGEADSDKFRTHRTNFDVSLAAKHEYLGADLEELRGRTVHDEESIVWIPILLEMGIILVPGQTLPMTVFYPPTISMFRDVIEKDKTFGIVSVHKGEKSEIGTTAEIYEYQENLGLAGFKIKAKGRQRFRLLEDKWQMPGVLLGKVFILPEITLNSPFNSARLLSLDRYRRNSSFKQKNAVADLSCAPWPTWLCDQHDPSLLVSKITTELVSLKLVDDTTTIPKDATSLSYWVAQCLPFDDTHRIAMLGFNTAVERLQYALRLFDNFSTIYCERCGEKIASSRDIFSMSVEGPQGTYCNPGGHIHEILTITQALAANTQDEPSTEFSWFPGYGWTIANCSRCGRHLGWLFTAMTSDLQPETFWGLARRSVTMYQRAPAPGRSRTVGPAFFLPRPQANMSLNID